MFRTPLSSQTEHSEMAVHIIEPWACDPFVYFVDSETLC